MTTSDLTTEAHGNGQYAEVNGIKLYFETHGAGRPMILLHGGALVRRDVTACPARPNQPGGGVKF